MTDIKYLIINIPAVDFEHLGEVLIITDRKQTVTE